MRTITKLVNAFVLFVAIYSCVCAAEEESIKVAVWEFENNSGRPDLEHLKKGIRDMITTDITQVNNITVVERARIDQIFKEINLSKSQYFDKENSVKIGKMIGATYLLTGSYLLDMNTIRIDVRLVNVTSGVIVYAEKVQGEKGDFFSLEKDLVSAIVEKMKPSITKRELRKVNQIQTESYATFDTYSQAVYLEEQGKLAEAVKIMQKATEGEQSFKMAQEKLSLFQKALSERIIEQTEFNAKAEKSLKAIMDSDLSKCKAIVEMQDHSSAYYLSILSLAVHYGLRSDFQNERDCLLKFWDEFSKEPEAGKIWGTLQKEMGRKSLVWENILMKIDTAEKNGYMSFSGEAEKLYDYPRFTNIWPFCQRFGIIPPVSLETRRDNATHKLLPHDFFSEHYNGTAREGLDFRSYTDGRPSARKIVALGDRVELKKITKLERLKIETSIAVFYINHSDMKIPKKNFDSIIRTVVYLLGDCSPYDSKNAYTKNDVLLLLKRLSLISQQISDKNQKLTVDKFILLLTKFLKGDAPGDSSAKGITISKSFFAGDNIAIISFLPKMRPIMETDYQKCLIKGIQACNPNSKIYIATEDKILSNTFMPATRENITKSIDFLKENIYRLGQYNNNHLSIDGRLIEAYMAAPETGDTHIILLLGHTRQLASHLMMHCPYYFKMHPKNIKLSIILTQGTLDDQKKYEKKRKMEKDSLLNLVAFTGGDIYLNDIKRSLSSQSQAKKWFDEKMKVFSTQPLKGKGYDQLQISWEILPSEKFDHIEIYRDGSYLNPVKLSATEKVYTIKNLKRGKNFIIHVVGIRKDGSEAPLKTIFFQVMQPNFTDKISNVNLDGDGFSNVYEIRQGCNPIVATDHPPMWERLRFLGRNRIALPVRFLGIKAPEGTEDANLFELQFSSVNKRGRERKFSKRINERMDRYGDIPGELFNYQITKAGRREKDGKMLGFVVLTPVAETGRESETLPPPLVMVENEQVLSSDARPEFEDVGEFAQNGDKYRRFWVRVGERFPVGSPKTGRTYYILNSLSDDGTSAFLRSSR